MKEKINELNFNDKNMGQLYKFMGTLSLVSVEDIRNTQNELSKYNMAIDKPSMIKLALFEPHELEKQFSSSEKISEVKVVESKEDIQESIEQIMSAPQTVGLTEETFQKYKNLEEYATKIIQSLGDQVYLDLEEVFDNIVKLVTNKITDDKKILFYSISHNKNLTKEEKALIGLTINNEMALIQNANKELVRSAS